MESDELKSISTHCVNRGFILLGDQIAEFYGQNSSLSTDKAAPFLNPFEMRKPLAKLIPIINGLLSKQFPEALVQELTHSEKLQTLDANIYECLL